MDSDSSDAMRSFWLEAIEYSEQFVGHDHGGTMIVWNQKRQCYDHSNTKEKKSKGTGEHH